MLDPVSFQQMEREALVAAILEGEKDIQQRRTQDASAAFAALKAKHGF